MIRVSSFCKWNINTLSKTDKGFFPFASGTVILLVKLIRVSFLEAHNSIFNYDIISLCETSLNHASKANILKGYHFFSLSHPNGDKKGIFYKGELVYFTRKLYC